MIKEILKALRRQGYNVLYVKGIFIFKDGQRISKRRAAKLAGITIKSKPREHQLSYGDYAWIAAINRVKS